MAESMTVEAKRLSALETKSVIRKTLEVHAASVREFCGWSGLLADSNVEALEVDRLLTEFMNLLSSEGHRAWNGEKLLASVLFFFPTLSQLDGNRLARSFRALPSFSRRPLLAAVWSALAVERGRIGGTLAAVRTLVMFEAYLRPGEMLSLRPQTFEFPGIGGGWYCYFLRPVPREAKLERRTTRSVSTQNDVSGWSQCSIGFSDDNHSTSPCST